MISIPMIAETMAKSQDIRNCVEWITNKYSMTANRLLKVTADDNGNIERSGNWGRDK